MYVCYLFEIDFEGNKKSGSIRLKLPLIPRLGDDITVCLSSENPVTISGVVKSVEMHCSVDKESDGLIPEAKELIWYIAVKKPEV